MRVAAFWVLFLIMFAALAAVAWGGEVGPTYDELCPAKCQAQDAPGTAHAFTNEPEIQQRPSEREKEEKAEAAKKEWLEIQRREMEEAEAAKKQQPAPTVAHTGTWKNAPNGNFVMLGSLHYDKPCGTVHADGSSMTVHFVESCPEMVPPMAIRGSPMSPSIVSWMVIRGDGDIVDEIGNKIGFARADTKGNFEIHSLNSWRVWVFLQGTLGGFQIYDEYHDRIGIIRRVSP